jgi:hypothetical protein
MILNSRSTSFISLSEETRSLALTEKYALSCGTCSLLPYRRFPTRELEGRSRDENDQIMTLLAALDFRSEVTYFLPLPTSPIVTTQEIHPITFLKGS